MYSQKMAAVINEFYIFVVEVTNAKVYVSKARQPQLPSWLTPTPQQRQDIRIK